MVLIFFFFSLNQIDNKLLYKLERNICFDTKEQEIMSTYHNGSILFIKVQNKCENDVLILFHNIEYTNSIENRHKKTPFMN